MAGKKENLKSLFTNTRTRVIIIFTAILLILAVVIGFFKLRSSTESPSASAEIAGAPPIQSIPGSLDPTAQYAKLQEEQNISQAEKALKTGKSALPTLIRTQAIGEGGGAIGSPEGKTGVGFKTLASSAMEGTQQSLWLQSLQNSNCSKTAIQAILDQGGQLPDLKPGCSCLQLKNNGYSLQDLKSVCDCKELKAAGYLARDLKDAGFSAGDLRGCGYSACDERNAGYSAEQMKEGGYSDGELKGSGFTDEEIAKASGLPPNISINDIRKAGCEASSLNKLRQEGVSAALIKRVNGCTAEQLKTAGYSAKDLKNAGFSAGELKRAGFPMDQLKDAGFTAGELEDSKTGFIPIGARDHIADCSVDSLKKAKANGVSALAIKQTLGCSAQALKDAGYSAKELKDAGFSAGELKKAGFSMDQLKDAGFTPKQLEAAKAGFISLGANGRITDCSADSLKKARANGVSALAIKETLGCSAKALKDAGYTAKELKDAGFSAAELKNAGFPEDQLEAAGYTPKELDNAKTGAIPIGASARITDCSVDSLKKAKVNGVSALTIKQTLGCSAKALKDAGYSAKDLKNAGLSAAELKNAGFSPNELKDAGFSARDLLHAGFPAKTLKDLGYSLADLKEAGVSPDELKNLGYTPAQLKAAGFDAKALRTAGFSPEELKAAGFSAKDLKDAGFTAEGLKRAGFRPKDLKDAGYTADEVKIAGFNANDLKDAGFNVDSTQVAGLAPGSPIPVARTPQEIQAAQAAENTRKLQAILARQNQQQTQQQAEAKYQQRIQQKTGAMLGAANQFLGEWRKFNPQQYVAGKEEKILRSEAVAVAGPPLGVIPPGPPLPPGPGVVVSTAKPIIKTGDILFAVIDTAVNTDEPGPILATIVSGRLKGSKLIGSFNLPPNANKMVVSFNTLSMLGAPRTTSVSAFAIDPNTGRTALSSRTNHHYLMRYGSLFASSFLEGFGNAFQAANTAITIGGTGGGNNITVQSGIGQSALENAVIGLATVGKSWGQQAQLLMNRPTTVLLCAGTGIGVLFTQDVSLG